MQERKRHQGKGRSAPAFVAPLILGLIALSLVGTGLFLSTGGRALSVRSGSMEPAIATGDIAVTRAIEAGDARVGDIVTFKDASREGELVTHRVVEVERRGDRVAFVTRGDSNTGVESWEIDSDGTIGGFVFRIPKAGYFLLWLGVPGIRVASIVFAAAVLAVVVARKRAGRGDRRITIPVGAGLAGLVVLGIAAGSVTSAAFSGTSVSESNSFTAGSVAISDNDDGNLMLSMSSAKPGASSSACIKIVYDGTLDSFVRLYGTTAGTGLDQYLSLTVTRGTFGAPESSFASCSNFAPDAVDYIGAGNGVVYSGTLQGFPDDFPTGLVDPVSGSPEVWTSGESHVYRFVVTLIDDGGAQGLDATQNFTWEARNN